jgi:hypothetical protein
LSSVADDERKKKRFYQLGRQGEFPPPSLGGLSVKIEEDDDLLTQDPLGVAGQSLDNLCLGAEANYGNEIPPIPSLPDKTADQHNSASRIIGGITIAEYDGSPRRYRPRGSNETASNARWQCRTIFFLTRKES